MSDEIRHARGRTVYVAVLLSVVASVATTYALKLLHGTPEEGGSDPVHVPDLVGVELDEARELAKNRQLDVTVAAERHSDREVGHIIAQGAFPESLVASGSEVAVITSLGPQTVELPDLSGQTVDTATARLEALGLGMGQQTEGGEGEAGAITSTVPEAGSQVAVGSLIAVTTAPEGIVIPEGIVGRNYRTVRTELQELGLTVNIRRRWDDYKPPLSVLSADPEEGTRVEPGSAVTLNINE